MLRADPLSNVLYIDLSKKHYRTEKREDIFEKYIGGTGAAIQILHEECPQGCDALSQENPIILAVGPLTALFPLASKTVAMFKSPLTGNLGESHCGGRSAVAIRLAGYGAIVIKGASDIPVYLAVHSGRVYFRDASSLWGMRSNFTVGRIIRENEPGAGLRTIMRIGRAGERLVSYACVTTETYRHFGRLGLGAVFGSKKLKAVMVSGKSSLPVRDKSQYREVYDEIYRAAVKSEVMKKYHDLGTAENILPLNELGALPTKNLRTAKFDGVSGISGEKFAEQYLGRRLACSHCPVGCIHIAALREPYEDEVYFYKTSMISYDYEPIYALGPMLGNSDTEGMLRLMDMVEAYGLDAMSTGVALAWATEAMEKGIISEKEAIIRLNWGDYRAYKEGVRMIVEQPNEFYRALAHGVEYASSVYGGEDYALAFGKNEMPGYHTGAGAHIGILIGARHSHLDNAGYSIDQKALARNKNPLPEELVEALLAEERWRQILSSLAVCFFARGIYLPETVLKALRQAGFDLSIEDLPRIGEEIHREKYRFKIREGFSLESLRIPGRILETLSPAGRLDERYIREAIGHFRRLMTEPES